jgi:hypothetical protein
LLEDADEMIARLGSMLDKVITGQEELAGRLAEQQRLRADAEEQLATAETCGKSAAILTVLAARGIPIGIVLAVTATSAEEVVGPP